MNKISMLAILIPATLFFAGADCTGSNVTQCETDADCADLTDTTSCEDVAGQLICVANTDVCTEDTDCELASSDSATSVEACEANTDCDAGDERCVEDNVGVTYCALVLDAADCDATNSIATLEDVDGASFTTCLGDGTCADGQCS